MVIKNVCPSEYLEYFEDYIRFLKLSRIFRDDKEKGEQQIWVNVVLAIVTKPDRT